MSFHFEVGGPNLRIRGCLQLWVPVDRGAGRLRMAEPQLWMIVPVRFTIQFEQNIEHERQTEADERAKNCKVHLFDVRLAPQPPHQH